MRPVCFFYTFLWVLAQQGETVAQGQDDGLHARVSGYDIVEGHDAAKLRGLGVINLTPQPPLQRARGSDYLIAPQGVVSKDVTARTDMREDGIVVINVVALVGVDEDEVEDILQACLQYVFDVQGDVGLDVDGAGDKVSALENEAASPIGGNVVDGSLDDGGVEGFTVGLGAKVGGEIILGSGRQGECSGQGKGPYKFN